MRVIAINPSVSLINRNELWDHESNKSLGSYMPPQKNEYGSRAPSAYGYDGYDQPQSRIISPAGSYADLRPRSNFEPPQIPYSNSFMGQGSPMSGMVPLAPQSDTRSFHGGDTRSFYGGDTRSFYGGDNRSGSFYGQPVVENRGSSYSLIGAQTQTPAFDRASSYGFPPEAARMSSYSYGAPASRPQSNFLPEMNVETTPIALGAEGITDSQLEGSIRRICGGADLDTLTKKGVRKQLEEEYGVGLTSRKDGINRIIEKVLAGEWFVDRLCGCL